MNASPRNEGCTGCAISREDRKDEHVLKILAYGGTLRLKGNWVLHHYVAREGFLGWLALQPYEHRGHLRELTDDEGREFGGTLKAVEQALHAYWEKEFPGDPLEHVYVVFFSESSKHLHLHIVPRPKSFRDLCVHATAYSEGKEIEDTTEWPYGWRVHLANKCCQFPDRYQKDEQKTKKLIEFLKTKLPLA